MTEIVVVIRGGVFVEAYSAHDAQVTVIDWDNHSRTDRAACVDVIHSLPIEAMHEDVAAVVAG